MLYFKIENWGGEVKTMIDVVISGLASVLCFALGAMQLRGKGVPLNNGWLYAGRRERDTMDKAPLYRQSGIVLTLLGAVFAVLTAAVWRESNLLTAVSGVLMAVTMVYAVVSGVRGMRHGK